MTEKERGEYILSMKGMPHGGPGAVLPVRDKEMRHIGYLRGFDRSMLDDHDLIARMARWHTMYKKFFLTQFDVTPENKRAWLRDRVLPSDSKMLFLVETPEHKVVGQYGFTLLEDDKFCLDANLRGERGGSAELFLSADLEICALCYTVLGCVKCENSIFKSNEFVIVSGIHNGYTLEPHEQPLRRTERDGMIVYEPTAADEGTPDEFLCTMSMTAGEFEKRYAQYMDMKKGERL